MNRYSFGYHMHSIYISFQICQQREHIFETSEKNLGLSIAYNWVLHGPKDPSFIDMFTGWWFQPLWKNISQWEGLSHILWKNKNCSKPPTSQLLLLTFSLLMLSNIRVWRAYDVMSLQIIRSMKSMCLSLEFHCSIILCWNNLTYSTQCCTCEV
jgi:hypothetical protein